MTVRIDKAGHQGLALQIMHHTSVADVWTDLRPAAHSNNALALNSHSLSPRPFGVHSDHLGIQEDLTGRRFLRLQPKIGGKPHNRCDCHDSNKNSFHQTLHKAFSSNIAHCSHLQTKTVSCTRPDMGPVCGNRGLQFHPPNGG